MRKLTLSFLGAFLLINVGQVQALTPPAKCYTASDCGSGYECVFLDGHLDTDAGYCRAPIATPVCKKLWWFDSSSSTCTQKSFCGAYMYQGLRTFSTLTECQKALKVNCSLKKCGDANCDGKVNTQDLMVWMNERNGKSKTADFNNDGKVDSKDYEILKNGLVYGCGKITPTPTATRPVITQAPPAYNCDMLYKLNLGSTQNYFDLCASNKFAKVCFNKYTGVYQGCGTAERDDCTVYNMNAAKNIQCDSKLASVTATPTPSQGNAPWCGQSTIAPQSGAAPLAVTLFGSGSAGNGPGIDGYRWDFDGNGTWDTSGVSIEPVKHIYTTAGVYRPKFQVHGINNVWSAVCDYGYDIKVTPSAVTPTPVVSNTVNWNTQWASFKASNYQIQVADGTMNGRIFRVNPSKPCNMTTGEMVCVHSNPPGLSSNGLHYMTLEVTWYENDIEMRMFVYLYSDGKRWWSNEIRVYNGQAQPNTDWVYFYGKFFDTPVGQNFTQTTQFSLTAADPKNGNTPVTMKFSNVSFGAFKNYFPQAVTPTPLPTTYCRSDYYGGTYGPTCGGSSLYNYYLKFSCADNTSGVVGDTTQKTCYNKNDLVNMANKFCSTHVVCSNPTRSPLPTTYCRSDYYGGTYGPTCGGSSLYNYYLKFSCADNTAGVVGDTTQKTCYNKNDLVNMANKFCSTHVVCSNPTPTVVKSCVTDKDCLSGQICYQPPMPTCPVGAMCTQVIPIKYCKSVAVTTTPQPQPTGTWGCNKKGDADGDGKVTLKDYAIWKYEYSSGKVSRSDFSCDKVVDLNDYAIWKKAFLEARNLVVINNN